MNFSDIWTPINISMLISTGLLMNAILLMYIAFYKDKKKKDDKK